MDKLDLEYDSKENIKKNFLCFDLIKQIED